MAPKLLLLCWTMTLGAEVCQNLAPAPSQRSNETTAAYKLSGFRIAVSPRNIEVSRCSDGGKVQVIPHSGRPGFRARDANFDGYPGFAVLAESGGKWASESWWFYEPASRRFAQNQLSRDLRVLQAAEVRFDPRTKEVVARYLTEPWGCGSTGDRYRVENGRLVLIHKEAAEPEPGACVVTVSERAAGTLRVTSVRRFVNGVPAK
jgi:hypothetical protein